MSAEYPNSDKPRYSIYRVIHKALRREMCDTLNELGRVDVESDDELVMINSRIHRLVKMLRGHAHHENDHIHTAIESRVPGASRTIAAQHDEHSEAMDALKEQCRLLLAAEPGARSEIAYQLYQQFALMVGDNLQHMHLEEKRHNALLWANFSDDEIRQIEQRIVSALPPEENEVSLRWMAASVTPRELALLMEGMRQALPDDVFYGVLAEVANEIGDVRHARLLEMI